MKLDKVFQIFVPKDTRFFPLFEQNVANLHVGATTLIELLKADTHEKRLEFVKEIKRLENVGDDFTHKIFNELNGTFITPFDREDINKLASSMDDILDFINGTAQRISLFKPKNFPDEFLKLGDIILQSVIQLELAINELKNLKNPEKIKEACIKINSLENEADDVYHKALSDLFDNEKDAVELIKKREIIMVLEKATDKCEDVSDVLKSIIVKNA